jgi:hypothetical protein
MKLKAETRYSSSAFTDRRDQAPVIDTDESISVVAASTRSRLRTPKKIVATNVILKPAVTQNLSGKRVEMKTPQQDQLHQKEVMVDTQTSAIAQQQMLLNLYDQVKPKKDDVSDKQYQKMEELLQTIKQSMSMQAAIVNKQQQEIDHSKQIAQYYSPNLKQPTLYEYTDMSIPGTREALQAKNVKAAIDTFNPD